MRSRMTSIRRIPVPYSSRANSAVGPSICANTLATSSLVKTLGIRRLLVGRLMSLSDGRSISKTSRYKKNGAQGLVVGGCKSFALGRKHGQKSLHSRCPDVARMLHLPIPPMPTNEKPDPVLISLLGAEAIVQIANALARLIHQASGFQRGRARFYE